MSIFETVELTKDEADYLISLMKDEEMSYSMKGILKLKIFQAQQRLHEGEEDAQEIPEC